MRLVGDASLSSVQVPLFHYCSILLVALAEALRMVAGNVVRHQQKLGGPHGILIRY